LSKLWIRARDRLTAAAYEYRRRNLFRKYFLNGPKKDAILLASYPKSGNTLLRFIWLNMIAFSELEDEVVDFQKLDQIMPSDQFFTDLEQPWRYHSLPCLLKTHQNYRSEFQPFQAIHVVRNPLDAMVSNYNYFKARIGGPSDQTLSGLEDRMFSNLSRHEGSFDNFVREHFQSWCDHYLSWQQQSSIPVAYEALTGSPAEEVLTMLMQDLSLEVEQVAIVDAIRRSDRKVVGRLPPSSKMANLEGMNFVRDGSTGQWQSIFSEEALDYVQGLLRDHGISKERGRRYQSLQQHWPIECFS
jgi:estrone sulfotransferase